MNISEEVASKFAGYYVNHSGFWRDLKRIRTVINHLDSYSEERLAALRTWYELHRDIIVHHHVAEDDFFFPKVSEKIGEDANVFGEMVKEHHEMDEVIKNLDTAFNAKDRTLIKKNLELYADLVEQHLKEEEEIFVPIIERKLDHSWCHKAESDFLKHLPTRAKIQTLAWAVEDMDKITRKHFWSKIPFPAKLMYKFKLKGDYERLVASAMPA